MADATSLYETPMELFLSAAQMNLPIQEVISMEVKRNHYPKSYAQDKLRKYEEKGYITSQNGKLEITDLGMKKLKGLKGTTKKEMERKPKYPSPVTEPEKTVQPAPEGEVVIPLDERPFSDYGGKDIDFTIEPLDTGRAKYYKRTNPDHKPELYMEIKGSRMQLLFERDEGLWGWSMVPVALLALYNRGETTAPEIEEALNFHRAEGRRLDWIIRKIIYTSLLTESMQAEDNKESEGKENFVYKVSANGELLLEELCKTLYGDDGKLSDLLYGKKLTNGSDITKSIDGCRIPPVYWLADNARNFFGYSILKGTETKPSPEKAREPKTPEPKQDVRETDKEKEPIKIPSEKTELYPPEGGSPEKPQEYGPLPPVSPQTKPAMDSKRTYGPNKEILHINPPLSDQNIILSRAEAGSTSSCLKIDKDGTVVYHSNKGYCKDHPVVLVQYGALTLSGLALQEMIKTGKAKRSINSLIESGLIAQYWPERGGETSIGCFNSKKTRKKKNESRYLTVTEDAREILRILEEKQVNQPQSNNYPQSV